MTAPSIEDQRGPKSSLQIPNATTAGLRAIQWHRIWLSVAGFLFILLCSTGLFLMTVYTPSTTGAWGSVWYIQTQMSGGWFIRGLHRFSSDALMLVLPIYLLHLLLTKAYRPPNHARWWIGWLSLGVAMATALSGYLLPWDQRGYWGMKVRLNILATTPIVGDWLRDFLIGGQEMGSLTLTRFYTLHIAALPLALGLMMWYLRRKHSPPQTTPRETSVDSSIQTLIQAFVNVLFLAIVVSIAWYDHLVWRGFALSAPADPAASEYPARPEWFNLFLFQWLKYFHGPTMETMGAVVIPGAMIAMLVALPYVHKVMGRDGRRKDGLAHAFATSYVLFLVISIVWLTYASIRDDRAPPETIVRGLVAKRAAGQTLSPEEEKVLRARDFNRQRLLWTTRALLASRLAHQSGIPPEGALALLKNDPKLRGGELFAANCAACHRFAGRNGLGIVPDEPPTSSDLANYATPDWIRGLLTNPMDDKYFGRMKKPDGTPAHTRMAKFLKELREEQPDDAARGKLEADLDAVAAYLADEALHPGRWADPPIKPSVGTTDSADNPAVEKPVRVSAESTVNEAYWDDIRKRGRDFFMSICNECHSYRGQRSGTFSAPEMYGYGSVEWLELMIAEPSHETRYRSTGREPAQMPPFRDRLTADEIKLLARWIHGDRG